jgi:uncharacterized protein (TIGR02265 family)
MSHFSPPNLRQPIAVEACILATPESATVKGMYIQRLAELVQRQGAGAAKRYVAFKDYPMRELMRAVADAAALLHPSLPTREAICAVGRLVFPTLQSSIAGRVIFAFAGNNYQAALQRVALGYEHSQNPGSARLASLSAGEAVVELRSVWNFPDCYQVGVHEGALTWYEKNGSIELRTLSPCDVDLRIRWS